jgi:hypothetical protein
VSAYDTLLLDDTPVGFWPLDVANGLNDLSGNNFHLTVGTSNGAQAGTGPYGEDCYDFNGTSHYHKTANDAITTMLATDSTVTMEFWFRSESAATLRTPAALRGPTDGGVEMIVSLLNSPSNGNARGWRYGNFRTTGTGALNDSAWHHRVDRINGTAYDIFVDGSLLQSGTTTVGGTAVVPFVVVGANYGASAQQWFDGQLAKVAVYDYSLSDTQITDHYNWLANPPNIWTDAGSASPMVMG